MSNHERVPMCTNYVWYCTVLTNSTYCTYCTYLQFLVYMYKYIIEYYGNIVYRTSKFSFHSNRGEHPNSYCDRCAMHNYLNTLEIMFKRLCSGLPRLRSAQPLPFLKGGLNMPTQTCDEITTAYTTQRTRVATDLFGV